MTKLQKLVREKARGNKQVEHIINCLCGKFIGSNENSIDVDNVSEECWLEALHFITEEIRKLHISPHLAVNTVDSGFHHYTTTVDHNMYTQYIDGNIVSGVDNG